MAAREALIKNYFLLGLNCIELQSVLSNQHGIHLGIRHLKRLLCAYGLRRRKRYTNLGVVVDFIENEIKQSGRLHGYRWMHLKCLQNRLTVKRETVRIILGELDPEGVDLRRRHRLVRRRYTSRGPNFVWHIDGYDKLKPYGICIHGCIDGYSRKIIWLRAAFTNNDPTIIGGYYVQTVSALHGCPVRVRADRGTENGHVEVFQTILRQNANSCFLYGTSQLNQRIESWWRTLRTENTQFWMDFFEVLKDEGTYSGDILDKSLIQACFLKIIQRELNEVTSVWNGHKIRPYTGQRTQHGRPIVMYEASELYQTHDYLCPVDVESLDPLTEECTFIGDQLCADNDISDLVRLLMLEHGIIDPVSPSEAIDLYMFLRTVIHAHV